MIADERRPPRVAGYLLLPCHDEAEATALRAQLAEFQRSLGEPAAVYAELCEGHRSRPMRQRLVRRAARAAFDMVAVLTTRHLARSRARVADLAIRIGLPIVSPDLRIDPADNLVRWLADERNEIRHEIREALAGKRRRGERAGAIRTGLRLAPDGVHVEPDPGMQKAIELACEFSASGLALREIARRLTQAGYRTRAGNAISHRQVRRWLTRARPDDVSQLNASAPSRDY